MPVLIKQLPVIIVSKAVIIKKSPVTCVDVLLEMFLPNFNEIAQQSIATERRDRPGVQRRVIHLCPGFPQMWWGLSGLLRQEKLLLPTVLTRSLVLVTGKLRSKIVEVHLPVARAAFLLPVFTGWRCCFSFILSFHWGRPSCTWESNGGCVFIVK